MSLHSRLRKLAIIAIMRTFFIGVFAAFFAIFMCPASVWASQGILEESDRESIFPETNQSEFTEIARNLAEGRHKFAFSESQIVISTTGAKKPRHDDLILNEEVLSGGYIEFRFAEAKVSQVIIDNYSGRLCPSYASLGQVAEFLSGFIAVGGQINLVNNPNIEKCGEE